MWIVKESQLKELWKRCPEAKGPLVAWIKEIGTARYENPAQLRARYRSADFVSDKVIFNIGGNKYRLIVRFKYARPSSNPPLHGIAFVVFVGTHDEYDDLDVAVL